MLTAQFDEVEQQLFRGEPIGVGDNPLTNPWGCAFEHICVADIQDRCLETYINVNLHFFLDDNCEGAIAFADNTVSHLASDVYQLADDFVAACNAFNERASTNTPWHQDRWGAPITSAQCIPLRFVLNGVYFHCESAAQLISPGGFISGYSSIYDNPTYAAGFNMFLFDINATSNGFVPFYGARWGAIETFSRGSFIHEVGHGLELRHTHDGNNTLFDNCLDTWWRPREAYDANGDGLNEYFNNRCWDNTTATRGRLAGTPLGAPTYDFCDTDLAVVNTQHPCCDWLRQNNNLMTHSSWTINPDYASLPPCQMEILLTDLTETKCDLIEAINPSCPPPSAFVGLLPTVNTDEDCAFCFHTEASMHDANHRITIQLQTATGYVNFHSTNWEVGAAEKFCIAVSTTAHDKFAKALLLPDEGYRFILETRNQCGDIASYSLDFSTPAEGCDIDVPTSPVILESEIAVFPNPVWGGATLSYRSLEEADIKIYKSSIGTNGTVTSPVLKAEASGIKEAGNHSVQFSQYEMVQGVNYIIIVADDVSYIRSVIKY